MVKVLKVFKEKEFERMKELSSDVGCYQFNGGSIVEYEGTVVATFGVAQHNVSVGNLQTIAQRVRKVCLEEGYDVDEVHYGGLRVE